MKKYRKFSFVGKIDKMGLTPPRAPFENDIMDLETKPWNWTIAWPKALKIPWYRRFHGLICFHAWSLNIRTPIPASLCW